MKKALFIAAAAFALWAQPVTVTLPDGRTVILYENGTWLDQKAAEARAEINATKELQAIASKPLVRALIGRWESSDGKFAYEFREDASVSYVMDEQKKDDHYTVHKIDEERRVVRVNIGESSRNGGISWGGFYADLKFSADLSRVEDMTTGMRELRTIMLVKKR